MTVIASTSAVVVYRLFLIFFVFLIELMMDNRNFFFEFLKKNRLTTVLRLIARCVCVYYSCCYALKFGGRLFLLNTIQEISTTNEQ